MAKSNAVVSLVKMPETREVKVTVQGFPPMVVYLGNLDEQIVIQAALHGIGQKLVDAAALSRDPANGKPATAAEKYDAIKAVYDSVIGGTWNAEREGGATSMLFEALCRMLPDQSPESIKSTLDGLTDNEKRKLPIDPEVAPHYKAVSDERAARLGKGVDTKAVLSRFKA